MSTELAIGLQYFDRQVIELIKSFSRRSALSVTDGRGILNITNPTKFSDCNYRLKVDSIGTKALQSSFTLRGVEFVLTDIRRLQQYLCSLPLEECPKVGELIKKFSVNVKGVKPMKFSTHLNPNKDQQQKYSLRMFIKLDSLLRAATSHDLERNLSFTGNRKYRDATVDIFQDSISQHDAVSLIKKRVKHVASEPIPSQHQRKPISDDLMQSCLPDNMAISLGGNGQQVPTSDYDNSTSKVTVDFTALTLQDHLKKNPNLIDMFAKESVKSMSSNESNLPLKIRDGPLEIPSDKPNQWTYSTLCTLPSVAAIVDIIVQELRVVCEKLQFAHQKIRLCLVLDNSGSMSLHRNVLYECLVIVMEVLRKLELRFAVGRFGGERNQKVLKSLESSFTDVDGQFVLESMTFDEGTYPATGLARIVHSVFTQGKRDDQHDLALMITDGLTREREEQSYQKILNDHHISLGVLFIEGVGTESSSELLLKALKNYAVTSIIGGNEVQTLLPQKVAELLNNMLGKFVGSDNLSGAKVLTDETVQVEVRRDLSKLQLSSDWAGENGLVVGTCRTVYALSDRGKSIPRLESVKMHLNSYLRRSSPYTTFDTASGNLRALYQEFATSSTFKRECEFAWKAWNAEVLRLSAIIDELTLVMGEVVFPLNKFSRRKAALRGSSLHMQGLLKAITTEWSYKKIFSAKLAGGSRDHTVCLVLDVSTSMFGELANGLRAATVVLIDVLCRLGLDQFGLVVFGTSVRLVKTNEQVWDPAVASYLMHQLRFEPDDGTNDGHALNVAVDFLNSMNTRGEKKIFILTDGYGNNGVRLPLVLQRAEDAQIEVVAIAVGVDQTNLHSAYKRFLHCASACGLPEALKALFTNSLSANAKPDEKNAAIDQKKRELFLQSEATKDREALYSSFSENKVFKKFVEELAGEREQKLTVEQASNITVDICFCLDITGSMSRWLGEVKSQMQCIIRDIKAEISNQFTSLKLQLRFAVVAFRDICDEGEQFNNILEFTENDNEVVNFLANLVARGGGDHAEDVMGALDQCIRLKSWSQSNARFIVLITDAPGHGYAEVNGMLTDDYPQGVPGGKTVSQICDELLKEGREIELMFCCIKPTATMTMQKAFEAEYDKRCSNSSKTFQVVPLFDEKAVETSTFHFVFVLDESGSMEGQPWDELVMAYKGFLDQRTNDQGQSDYISVIQFASAAKITFRQTNLPKAPRNLDFHGGNTDYSTGLQAAEQVLGSDNSSTSLVMIFMSDGCNHGRDDPVKILENLKQQYAQRGFVCHTVAFLKDCAEEAETLLLKMAQTTGGQMFKAADGLQLLNVFNRIAANSNVTGTLVDCFAEILSKEISVKIMLDFL